MPTTISWQHARAIAERALQAGAERRSLARIVWRCDGACEKPYWVQLRGTELRGAPTEGARMTGAILLDIATRCRRCPDCRRARAVSWTARAINEWRYSERTWFGTLTLGPQHQAHYHNVARYLSERRGHGVLEGRPLNQQFWQRVGAISPEITRYLKRCRKESGSLIRFLWVAESHKSGDPHFHALIHEPDPARPIRKEVLEGQWKLGYTKWRLCRSEAAARYVCKYLTKDAAARVRASLHYGLGHPVAWRHPEGMVTRDHKIRPLP